MNSKYIKEKDVLLPGYGNMVPRTDWGKIATMIYAVIGNTA
jgi:hypothetical protein